MERANAVGLRLRGRSETYTLLAGVVVGLLVAGLAIPYLFGTPLTQAGQSSELAGDDRGDGEPGLEGQPVADEVPDERAREDETDPAGDGGSPAGEAPQEQPGDVPAPEVADGAEEAAAGGQASPNESSGTLTASDVGVTEESVRLGLLVLDVAGLAEVGVGVPGIDPEAQEEAWQAYVDHVNERGGIHGRQIEPVYERYDPFDPDSMRAACLSVTQDAEVFAVLDSGGMSGAAINCVTDENDTSMVTGGSQGTTTEMFQRAPDRLFSLLKGSQRLTRNVAHELEQMGELDGRTIGIVALEHEPQVADQLEQALAERGHEVAYRADLAQEYSQGSSQIPVEVQQMRANGADLVVLLAHVVYGTQFVQVADGQNYHPQYVTTNWRNANVDVYGDGMPDSYDGTIALTSNRTNEARAGLPEAEAAADCRERYEEATGKQLERDGNDYGAYLIYCDALDVLVRGAQSVGPELTMDGLADALRGLGAFPLAQMVGGTFAPGKQDAADYIRTMRWLSDCRCHMPQDDWRETRY